MKKNIFAVLILLVTLASCDNPRAQRATSSTSSSSLSAGNNTGVNLGNTTTGNTTTTTGNTTTTTTSIPSDATQCSFASDGVTGFESTSTHLGAYTLCQSSSDKNVVYFQLKTPPTNSNGNVNICFIPTTNNGSNSIYIGNPMCGTFTDPKSVRKITFTKFSQYSSATVTGVIFFKDLSFQYNVYYNYTAGYGYYPVYNQYINTLDAYKLCMSMIADIGNTTNCNYFKSVGQYVFKQF